MIETRELRTRAGDLTRRMRAILDGAEKDGRKELTADERTRYDAFEAEIADAERALRLAGIETWAARSLTGDDNGAARLFNGPPVAEPRAVPPAGGAGRVIGWDSDGRELRAFGRAERMGAHYDATEAKRQLAAAVKLAAGAAINPAEAQRAMMGGNTTTGGLLLSQPVSNLLVDLARAKARCIEAGALTLPMTSASLTIARLASDPVPAWKRELQDAELSDPTFDAWVARPKTLTAIVEASLDLLADASNVADVLSDSLSAALGLELDRAALVGEGVNAPLGLEGWVAPKGSVNQVTGVGTPDGFAKFVEAVTKVRIANGEPNAILLSPRDAGTLDALEDSTGQPLMRPKVLDSLLWLPTSQCPTDGGAGSNEGLAFVGDFAQLAFVVREEISLEVSREATVDGKSAFSRRSVFVRAHLRADILPLRDSHFTILSGITSA